MRPTSRLFVLTATLSCFGCGVRVAGDCDQRAHRQARIDTAGVSRIVLQAGAGELRITGRPGVTALTADGEACATSAARLEQIQLHHEIRGDVLYLWTDQEEGVTIRVGWTNDESRLDLTVEMPTNLPLEIEDGSGDVSVKSVSTMVLKDGSGGLFLADLLGDVDIEDGSGDLKLVGVDGNVAVEDGSGEIEITGVKGGVILEDGSGGALIRQVGGGVDVRADGSGDLDLVGIGRDVRVRVDGSGNITIRDVTGDVTVDEDGSGSIEVSGVGGKVSIPQTKRPKR